MLLRKFPSIEQFRHVVKDVTHHAEYISQDENDKPIYDASRPKPKLTFTGTVKLHGTNCGVMFDLAENRVLAQSRERFLSAEEDNFGFCQWVESEDGSTKMACLRAGVLEAIEPSASLRSVHVFGEWCGPQVNGKTGIGKLPLRWVIFSVLATDAEGEETWLDVEPVARAWAVTHLNENSAGPQLHFITDFPQFSAEIDFNDPGACLDTLERLTLEVEEACPVARALGGDGIGEGIVWACKDSTYGRHAFKVKGAKHKGTRSKRLVEVAPEVIAGLEAFADAVLTESRLEQGLDLIRAEHGKVTEDHIGTFLMWIGRDVLKEESDTLAASGLDKKQAMSRINHRAKAWLLPRLAKF